ncbi:MAG: DNA-processing protein DprA [Muribaculaceae bacterium]|nr:DNA-processing protein DprA [Muribaculaceae bacterium]
MDLRDILILSKVKGIGPAFIKKNRHRLSQEQSCETIVSEYKPEEMENLSSYAAETDKTISDCNANNIKMVSILDEDYPLQLVEIADPPSVLFMRGDVSLLKQAIAIIGTRESTELGNRIAERVGVYFSERFSICNGLVEGIDEHAIYHNGHVAKNVVGVISGGLLYKETCTSNHIRVIDDVLNAGGLIVSEFHPRQKEDRFSGSKASRIQAALSHGLILIQSKIDGGSKYTLASFSKLGRPMGVIHYPSSSEYANDKSFSANRLIAEQGADGLAQIIGIKSKNSINMGPISLLSNKEDYSKLYNLICKPSSQSLF